VAIFLFMANKTHPLYAKWKGMRRRCNNPNERSYLDYGGRGIQVCDRWNNFDNFVADMMPSFVTGMTLGRIDNDRNYAPENCRWETRKQQANNYRHNRKIAYRGVIKNLCEWAETTGVKRSTIAQRLDAYGWSVPQALGFERK
jgi:hypothetical protein